MHEKGPSSGSHARARRTVPHGSVPCDADPGFAGVLSSLPHLPYANVHAIESFLLDINSLTICDLQNSLRAR